jgi:hypothetical protein
MDDYPDPKLRDVIEVVAKAAAESALSMVPVPGTGGASRILDLVVGSSLERRRSKWFRELGTRVSALEEKVRSDDERTLAGDEAFVSTVMQATQAALRTHRDTKHEALLNAVENAALHPIQEDIQAMFIRFVDELTPWHLTILAYFRNPTTWRERRGITSSGMSMSAMGELLNAMPSLRGNEWFVEQVVSDLQARGLLRQVSLGTTTTYPRAGQTTGLGDSFLDFISDPEDRP